jgi:hypothetical protein
MKWSEQKENNKSDEAKCRLVWSFTIAQISAQKQLFGMHLGKKQSVLLFGTRILGD